jgi:uncharacterized protein
MKERSILVFCFAGLLLCASPAAAQGVPTPEMAAARELVTLMRMPDQFKAMLPQIMQVLRPTIVQGRPEVEHDVDIIIPVLLQTANARVAELTDQIAPVYARHFTADELRTLVAFYRQPLGQKLLEKMPVLLQEGMALGQAWGQKIAAEMQNRLIEELRKKGHKI